MDQVGFGEEQVELEERRKGGSGGSRVGGMEEDPSVHITEGTEEK